MKNHNVKSLIRAVETVFGIVTCMSTDLSATHPDKLKELQGVFLSEAVKYKVLPIDARPTVSEGNKNWLPRAITALVFVLSIRLRRREIQTIGKMTG